MDWAYVLKSLVLVAIVALVPYALFRFTVRDNSALVWSTPVVAALLLAFIRPIACVIPGSVAGCSNIEGFGASGFLIGSIIIGMVYGLAWALVIRSYRRKNSISDGYPVLLEKKGGK